MYVFRMLLQRGTFIAPSREAVALDIFRLPSYNMYAYLVNVILKACSLSAIYYIYPWGFQYFVRRLLVDIPPPLLRSPREFMLSSHLLTLLVIFILSIVLVVFILSIILLVFILSIVLVVFILSLVLVAIVLSIVLNSSIGSSAKTIHLLSASD